MDTTMEAVSATDTARRSTTIAGETLPPVDFLGLDELLTSEERAVRDRVRAFVDGARR